MNCINQTARYAYEGVRDLGQKNSGALPKLAVVACRVAAVSAAVLAALSVGLGIGGGIAFGPAATGLGVTAAVLLGAFAHTSYQLGENIEAIHLMPKSVGGVTQKAKGLFNGIAHAVGARSNEEAAAASVKNYLKGTIFSPIVNAVL